MARICRIVVACSMLVGCGENEPSRFVEAGPALLCGPEAVQVDDRCVAIGHSGAAGGDGGPPGSPVEAGVGDAQGGDGGAGSEGGGFVPIEAGATSSFAVDPAHDNAGPDQVVASPLRQAWVAQFQGTASYPVVDGNHVIIAANESQPNVRALDLATGSLVWGPITFGSMPLIAVEGGALFALSNGILRAMDASSGQMHWSAALQGQLDFGAPPVASGGLVYVNGLESGGTTYAVDERNGATIWTASTFDGSDGTVAVGGGFVFEAEACDQVSAFDALTGRRAWYHSTGCTGGGGSAPSFYAGQVWVRDFLGDIILDTSGNVTGSFNADYLPSFHGGTAFYMHGGTLSAVDVSSQTVKWTFAGDGGMCTSAVIAGAGGQVFLGSSLGGVYELDEATGRQKSVGGADAGTTVSCGSDAMSMGLGGGHLLVPAGSALIAY